MDLSRQGSWRPGTRKRPSRPENGGRDKGALGRVCVRPLRAAPGAHGSTRDRQKIAQRVRTGDRLSLLYTKTALCAKDPLFSPASRLAVWRNPAGMWRKGSDRIGQACLAGRPVLAVLPLLAVLPVQPGLPVWQTAAPSSPAPRYRGPGPSGRRHRRPRRDAGRPGPCGRIHGQARGCAQGP